MTISHLDFAQELMGHSAFMALVNSLNKLNNLYYGVLVGLNYNFLNVNFVLLAALKTILN